MTDKRTPLDEIRERVEKAEFSEWGKKSVARFLADANTLLAEVSSLESQRDTALANADFWERELNNFRRNAAHRAEQLAKEKVDAAESRLQAVTDQLDAANAKVKELGYILDDARGGVEGNIRRMERDLENAKGILSRDALKGAIEQAEHTLLRIAGAIGFGIDPRGGADAHEGREANQSE